MERKQACSSARHPGQIRLDMALEKGVGIAYPGIIQM
jgi:hypothetical protein